MTDTQKIVLFMLNEGTDHQGRFITDIWAFSDEALEVTHDYIQWLFPIPETTKFNRLAPGLTDEAIDWFLGSPELRYQQERSLERMLSFFGLKRTEDGITAQAHLTGQSHAWLRRFDHNHRRISRIIRSLNLCGQTTLARDVQSAVIQIGQGVGDVPDGSLEYWRKATQL